MLTIKSSCYRLLEAVKALATTSHAKNKNADAGTQLSFSDVHNHSFGPGYGPTQVYNFEQMLSENVREQIKLFDDAGVHYTLWAPIPTAMVGSSAHDSCCGSVDKPPHIGQPTYYMPNTFRDGKPMSKEDFKAITDNSAQYINTSVDEQVAKAFNELPADIKARVYPAFTGINLADKNTVHSLMSKMREYPSTFFAIGEITMHKEFVDRQNQNYVPDFSPKAPINDLFHFAARAGLPVVLHCDNSDAEPCIENDALGKGEHYANLKSLFMRHPKTEFVWAHMGGIGKYSPPPSNHVAALREMLSACPNVKIDMSWDVVAQNYSPNPRASYNAPLEKKNRFEKASFSELSCGYDDPIVQADYTARARRIIDMAELINDFPDRFIMGSDSLVARNPSSIHSTYAIYSNFGQGPGTGTRKGLFDHLQPHVLTKVLTGNFKELMDRALKRVREYEEKVLPDDLARIQSSIDQAGRTPNSWPADLAKDSKTTKQVNATPGSRRKSAQPASA